jgi:hypothetical protein
MTLDHIEQMHYTSRTPEEFAIKIARHVRKEMLALAHANTVVSNDATELYQDLQAYDRYESGLNY